MLARALLLLAACLLALPCSAPCAPRRAKGAERPSGRERDKADASDRGKKDETPGSCISISTRAHNQIGFFDHYVEVKSSCGRDAACRVTTNANPDGVDAEVGAGKTIEVLTFLRSPVQEFTAEIRCTFKP